MNSSLKKIETSNSFYDAIAAEYDNYMTSADKIARKNIAQLFIQYVPSGKMMDFGGGTGLDLAWLLDNGYQVFFLEPSPEMRAVVKKTFAGKSRNPQPIFLDEHAAYEQWSSESLPTAEKMDGVLANFAVLNCIQAPEEFFSKIAMICSKSGHLIITVLNPTIQAVYKNYSIVASLRMLLNGKLKILNKHKDVYHSVYIHSIQSLKKAARPFFDLTLYQPIPSSTFTVLVFCKR